GRDLHVSRLALLLVCVGLVLRTQIWPFHVLFTSVCREAPPSVAVALAAGAMPTAVYLFLRLSFALFPSAIADASPFIVGVGVVSLIVGCLSAAVQRGLRLLFALLCVVEMGLLLVGIGSLNPIAVVGALYQVLTFGIAIAGLGLFIGMTSDRTGKGHFATEKGESTMGGAVGTAPGAAVVVGVIIASVLGFPGLGGFVGNGLLMIGSFAVFPAAALIAAGVILLEAYCLFTVYKYVFLGPENATSGGKFPELSLRERVYMAPIVLSLVFLGVYPKPLIDLAKPTVSALLTAFGPTQ
ncbi:MAG: proton-conducting transporter membrane subunit, partial [Bdellovibrionota bacterium]